MISSLVIVQLLSSPPSIRFLCRFRPKHISTMIRSVFPVVATLAALAQIANAFAPAVPSSLTISSKPSGNVEPLCMSEEFFQETEEMTQGRIQDLVDNHSVLLFMKGSKLFPQCGFSNTAVQILQAYDIDFHTVDVLSDEAIRAGVKTFS